MPKSSTIGGNAIGQEMFSRGQICAAFQSSRTRCCLVCYCHKINNCCRPSVAKSVAKPVAVRNALVVVAALLLTLHGGVLATDLAQEILLSKSLPLFKIGFVCVAMG